MRECTPSGYRVSLLQTPLNITIPFPESSIFISGSLEDWQVAVRVGKVGTGRVELMRRGRCRQQHVGGSSISHAVTHASVIRQDIWTSRC